MSAHQNKTQPSTLIVGAIGVVFGDIGTSPLYALKETFAGHHAMAVEPASILGVLSLVFWTIMALVTVKYVAIIMRADNRGEGGSLALLARVTELTRDSRGTWFVTMLGIFAAALFYGDSMITPAISVLSAVEGLDIVAPQLEGYVLPITAIVLTALFWIQRKGTGAVGRFFGPIMCTWFGVLAVLGAISVWETPEVLAALNPVYAFGFLVGDPWHSFLALGAIVLAVTGGEALYTDMGHFGKFPIRAAWFGLVLPALVLNYYGQGALLLKDPAAIQSPFYLLAPGWALIPMVVLATAATVIASQAVISGAFSVARQAVQLGYLPRMRIVHTSDTEAGQIYVPFTNWTLYIAVMALVFGFQSSSNLGVVRRDPCLALESLAGRTAARRPAAGGYRLLLRECHQAAARRLVPGRHRNRFVHHADHLAARPQAAVPGDGQPDLAHQPVHPFDRIAAAAAGRRHCRVPDRPARRRAVRAAAQPEAQRGIARAQRAHHGADRGGALRR